MILMAKKHTRQKAEPDQAERKLSREQINVRMPLVLKNQLEELAARNLTDVSAEIIAACLDRLKSNGLWPPKETP